MWALTLLAVLQAARANQCVRISYGTDESGAKTVSKSFAITARSPEACKKNQFSGLGPTKAYALEVSILGPRRRGRAGTALLLDHNIHFNS